MVSRLALMLILWAGLGLAETSGPENRGPVTHLPMPRFVSLKSSEANVRRGPSMTHRIDWVYQRAGLPVQIIAEHGHWRKIRDRDGIGGWVHYSLLSGNRTVIIDKDIMLRGRPDPASTGVALFQAGVIARVTECGPLWCRLRKDRHRGWVPKETLWGVTPSEQFD